MRLKLGAVSALAVPVVALTALGSAQQVTDPPTSQAAPTYVMGDLREALVSESESGPAYLADERAGTVLYVTDLDSYSPRTRQIVADLNQSGSLTVRTGGIPQQTIPNELRVRPTVATVAGGYPEPAIAGVRFFVDVGDYQSYCTTAFGVTRPDGKKYVTSAGHCGWKTGQPVLNSTGDSKDSSSPSRVSRVHYSTWGTPGPVAGDAMVFYNESAKGLIYQGGSPARKVTGWQDPTLADPNICFRGATSAGAGSCGPVESVGTVFPLQGYEFQAFCVNATAKPGDSGAPMYVPKDADKASARGVLSFMQDPDGDGTYDRTCGTPMGAVLSATGSTLLTS